MRHLTRATAGISAEHVRGGSGLPPVIGHRGAATCAPENTLAGLRQAKALDCRWVEFDVRLTADGQPVLLHDSRFERTTDGRGKLTALSLAEVRRHDAGSWFGPSFAGERVPTLEEAVSLLGELGIGANVELKATRGRETQTGTVVAEMLTRLWPSKLPPPLISSFQPGALAAAKAGAPGVARGILFRAIPKNWRIIAERLGCATIHAAHQRLSPAIVAEIRGCGYPVLAYTVNDPGRASTLFGWGVTSVFSDAPQRLRATAVHGIPRQATTDSAGLPQQGSVW
jgi:glycerophosphoryl diester phosphodiesterase